MNKIIKEVADTVPLGEFYILQALRYYSEEVLQNQDKIKNSMKRSLIDPDFWIDNAKKVKDIL